MLAGLSVGVNINIAYDRIEAHKTDSDYLANHVCKIIPFVVNGLSRGAFEF
jgi:hypothetical protein